MDEPIENMNIKSETQDIDDIESSKDEHIDQELNSATTNSNNEAEIIEPPKISLENIKEPNGVLSAPINGMKESKNTMTCREWKTECPIREASFTAYTSVPEKDTILWKINDFATFRSAAKNLKIPPLVSPAFGGGCYMKLNLYGKNGHITGRVDLPKIKTVREGVAHVKICVLRGDLKVIITRKLQLRSYPLLSNLPKQDLTSNTFQLTKCACLCRPRVDHLSSDDSLRIRIDFQYFPFDSLIFRGLERLDMSNNIHCQFDTPFSQYTSTINLNSGNDTNENSLSLIQDINEYCKEDPSEYVEIRHGDTTFQACRFLLKARSTKFRDIFRSNVPPLNSGRSHYRNPTPPSALSSITIQNISSECLNQLLTFIHTDMCHWLEDRTTDILNVLELFEAADQYNIISLKKRLIKHLIGRIDQDNILRIYQSSEKSGDPELKGICSQFMDTLPGSQIAAIIHSNLVHDSSPTIVE